MISNCSRGLGDAEEQAFAIVALLLRSGDHAGHYDAAYSTQANDAPQRVRSWEPEAQRQ